jgi:arginine deiminase
MALAHQSGTQYAEWDPAVSVLMHTPNDGGELTMAGLHAPSALFEKAFDVDEAGREHTKFRALITEKFGVRVFTVREVLLEGTMAEDGSKLEGTKLMDLQDLARHSVTIVPGEGVSSEDAWKEVNASIDQYSPARLFDIVVQHPEMRIESTPKNTRFVAAYCVRPVTNLYFTRDQSIATPKGRVLMRLASTQRSLESRIIEFALKKLGQPVIYKLQAPDTMEGGDYIPAGKYAFQGQGLRTTPGAIKQLMDNDCYGSEILVVVKDEWHDQEQMHLDTFFNVINDKLVILEANRVHAKPTDKEMYTVADVYRRDAATGKYTMERDNVSFVELLKECGFETIIPVSREDQLIYGCNFLTMGPQDIILVKRDEGVSAAYRKALEDNGVRYHEVDLSSLTRGYGAAHCSSQVTRVRKQE